MKTVGNFNGLRCNRIADFCTAKGFHVPVFHIESQYTLTQFVGYAKFINNTAGEVFLRGQNKLYPTLYPSMYRHTKNTGGIKKASDRFQKFLKHILATGNVLRGVPSCAYEPLLQHYGIRTKWLDLVDNLWVAIWFGCHDCQVDMGLTEYVHFYPRALVENGKPSMFYILLFLSDATQEDPKFPGYRKGVSTFSIDLRKACPSTYLRPHAQHAVLARHRLIDQHVDADLMDNICGIAEMSVENGMRWLGGGNLISVNNLFPPANFDYGYSQLLMHVPRPKNKLEAKALGSININFA